MEVDQQDAGLDAEREGGEEEKEPDDYEHRSTPQPLEEEEEETTEGESEEFEVQPTMQEPRDQATSISEKLPPPRKLPFVRKNRQGGSQGENGSSETMKEEVKDESDDDDEL